MIENQTGGFHLQDEDQRISDLVFGVSPISGATGYLGRGTHLGTSYGGEPLTPPRYQFNPPGPGHWGHSPAYNSFHPPANSSRAPRLEQDISGLTQRFAASSLDSIDADSATPDIRLFES